MAYSFRHLPHGSAIGTGAFVFRHFGDEAPAPFYQYIDPVDPVAFPNYTGLKVLTLDGTELWKASGGAVYTSDFSDIIKSQNRASVVGFSADYTFEPSVQGIASMSNDAFIFNGTSSIPVNGNLSFKNDHTESTSAWATWLATHPLTILISTNDPDTSVWKPAKDPNGETGYWNGASGFVAVKGGIPYYGDNLITQDVITNYYQAYFATIGSNRYWRPATDSSRTVRLSVNPGSYYGAKWDETDSDIVGAVYRLGYTNDGTPKANTGNVLYNVQIWTPQDNPDEVLTATKQYMIIQIGGALFPENVSHLSVREMIGYTPSNDLLMGNPIYSPEPDPEGDVIDEST